MMSESTSAGGRSRRGLKAQGHLVERPVAVVDIGSNSVRLVIYEGAKRSPAPIFNEKELCGLGRRVASEGRLGKEASERAFVALRRFRAVAKAVGARPMHVIATAAVRDAADGDAFIDQAGKITGGEIVVLSGEREADLAANGVMAGIENANGIVGDLGGGSLELVDLAEHDLRNWVTLPLGGLKLASASKKNLKNAHQIVDDSLQTVDWIANGRGRPFYAVGGTWRAVARLHMAMRNYPLRVLHEYRMAPGELMRLTRELQERPIDFFAGAEQISRARQETVPYGALVLERYIRHAKPSEIVVSAFGIREGLIYSLLPEHERAKDPLLAACEDLAVLRSRSPVHAHELCTWTDQIFAREEIGETSEERRLRYAACLISDISWRVHAEYRGEQSVNIVENSAFAGIDHPGRAFLSLAVYYRHEGLVKDEVSQRLRELAPRRLHKRARILGAAVRAAHMFSVGQPGLIDGAQLCFSDGKLTVTLGPKLAAFDGERLRRRFRVLARELNRKPDVVVDGRKERVLGWP